MEAFREDPLLGSSETFNSFLRRAQQEVLTEEVSLEMLLSNGQRVLVNVLTSDQTEYVLEGVAAKLDIPDDLIGYFSLFLVREKEDGAFSCEFLRTLQLPSVSSSEFASLSPPRMWQSFPQGFPSPESDIFIFF